MTPEDRDLFPMQFMAMILCFAMGVFLASAGQPRPPATVRITEHQRRMLCFREQRAVVSQWRVWTEKAAATNECRGYVLRGDEP